MKLSRINIFIGLFICVLIATKANAQYPSEKDVFFDSLKTFWSDINKSDKAAVWAVEFKNKWPNSFNTRIENKLIPVLRSQKNNEAESAFLEILYNKNDSVINTFISPIYFWNKIQRTNNEKELDDLIRKFTLLLKDSANYLSRTERYGLAIVDQLNSKNYNQFQTNQLLDKLIKNIEQFKYIDITDAPEGSIFSWQRHWFRCLYSYTFYRKYLNDPNSEIAIEKAAYFSIDYIDKSFDYETQKELCFLFNDSVVPNFKIEYFNFLNKNKKELKAINYLTNITLDDPCDENFSLLKKTYIESKRKDSFEFYWKNKVDSIMVPFPKTKIVFNSGQEIEFGNRSKSWTFIDIWATWCPPCIKELPEIDKFYQQTKNNPSYKIEVFSMSYKSTNLKNFIAKKGYTFPVCEIPEEIIKKLGVTLFPTKILLSPEGKFLKLPHGNWKEYVKNYMLMDFE